MGRLHRRPKRLNLRSLLRDSSCEFVFDASQISADEFLEFQARFPPVYGTHRLLRKLSSTPNTNRILIVIEHENCVALCARLHEGWRGVVVLPADARQRREALSLFFMQQLRYRISHPHWASRYRGEIPQFLLDLTKTPAAITPAELVVLPPKNEL
jgi:hypothetical protein